jgi:predicted Zn finger-like uncharacterized protein
MPSTVHCPSCSRELRVPDELIGKKVKCPACSTTFTASMAPEAAAPAGPGTGYESGTPSAPGAEAEYQQAPAEDYDRPKRIGGPKERVRGRVMAPAICLLVAAIIGALADIAQIFLAMTPAPQLPPAQPGEPEFIREFQKNSHGPIAMGGGALGAIYCGVIIFASIQMMNMRMWGFALAGSIMSMINCFNCCCLLGLPFGIWALVILLNEEVKSAFS